MEPELQQLESRLRDLRPAELDEALLDRLARAADESLQGVDAMHRPVEASAARLQPAEMSESLMARLEGVVKDVPFPVDEKVVLFPRGSAGKTGKSEKRRPWMAAAAAVALAGGLAALMVSPKDDQPKMTSAPAPVSEINPAAFVPASFDSGVSDTNDLGVMWSENRKPVRVVRVTYMDTVTFVNEKGDRLQRDIPRVEYLVVPEQID
ncbi:MAG: hypothetical protein AAGI48_11010 [Verrucomicrobiota bacterium]